MVGASLLYFKYKKEISTPAKETEKEKKEIKKNEKTLDFIPNIFKKKDTLKNAPKTTEHKEDNTKQEEIKTEVKQIEEEKKVEEKNKAEEKKASEKEAEKTSSKKDEKSSFLEKII